MLSFFQIPCTMGRAWQRVEEKGPLLQGHQASGTWSLRSEAGSVHVCARLGVLQLGAQITGPPRFKESPEWSQARSGFWKQQSSP